MSDNPNTALAIGIVAVITAVSSGIVLICKTLKKSDCLGIHIETRTPRHHDAVGRHAADECLAGGAIYDLGGGAEVGLEKREPGAASHVWDISGCVVTKPARTPCGGARAESFRGEASGRGILYGDQRTGRRTSFSGFPKFTFANARDTAPIRW